MTLPKTIDTMLARIDDLGYKIVERNDYKDRTVIHFKRPKGRNIGAVLGDYTPGPGACYAPEAIANPAAGSGAFLIDAVQAINPPHKACSPEFEAVTIEELEY